MCWRARIHTLIVWYLSNCAWYYRKWKCIWFAHTLWHLPQLRFHLETWGDISWTLTYDLYLQTWPWFSSTWPPGQKKVYMSVQSGDFNWQTHRCMTNLSGIEVYCNVNLVATRNNTGPLQYNWCVILGIYSAEPPANQMFLKMFFSEVYKKFSLLGNVHIMWQPATNSFSQLATIRKDCRFLLATIGKNGATNTLSKYLNMHPHCKNATLYLRDITINSVVRVGNCLDEKETMRCTNNYTLKQIDTFCPFWCK